MLFVLFMQFIFIQRGGVGTQFRKGTNVSSEKGNSTSVNQTDNIIITPCLCQRCGAEFGIKIHKGCLLDYNYACPKCGQKVYVKFGKPIDIANILKLLIKALTYMIGFACICLLIVMFLSFIFHFI